MGVFTNSNDCYSSRLTAFYSGFNKPYWIYWLSRYCWGQRAELIILAWSITEVIRYSFYLAGLLKKESQLLLFCRYTFFIVLYPMGVTGELLIVYSYLLPFEIGINLPSLVLTTITLVYIIFFPKMYLHMWSQRRKKLA